MRTTEEIKAHIEFLKKKWKNNRDPFDPNYEIDCFKIEAFKWVLGEPNSLKFDPSETKSSTVFQPNKEDWGIFSEEESRDAIRTSLDNVFVEFEKNISANPGKVNEFSADLIQKVKAIINKYPESGAGDDIDEISFFYFENIVNKYTQNVEANDIFDKLW